MVADILTVFAVLLAVRGKDDIAAAVAAVVAAVASSKKN